MENDGVEILTDSKSAYGSNLHKTLIDEYGEEKTNKITIPDIRGEVIINIVKYLEYLKDNPSIEIPRPLKNYSLKEFISEWDFELLKKYDKKIYDLIELINAADYLDISPLLDIACAKAATMVKDYDSEKFIEIFQIEQDLTDEELKQQEVEFQKKGNQIAEEKRVRIRN